MKEGHTKELKPAMPCIIGSHSSPCIGIRLCAAGRFVVCIDCRLSVEFPSGAHFGIVAKQFESHTCGSPISVKVEASSEKTIAKEDPATEALNCNFDHNANPMWVFDISTLAFRAVNDAAVNHYGYSRKEFLSMTILDISPIKNIALLLKEILQKGALNVAKEFGKHRKKDGGLIDVEVTRREVIFKGCVADIMTAVDVTVAPRSA